MAISSDLSAKVLAVVRRHCPDADPSGTFTLDDYVHSRARASHAFLYFALFCPLLVELEGSVLLQRSVEDQSDRKRFLEYRAGQGHRAAERSFNFVEVPYLFGPERREGSDEDDRVLADALAASWRAWLSAQFPGRRFVVEVLEPEHTGSVVGIHFYEARTATRE